MSRPVDSSNAGLNRAARRVQTSTTTLTSVGATGVVTTSAAFLRDLQRNDVVVFSGLTGGSGLTPGLDYYVLPIGANKFASGATTFQVATTPDGVPVTGGSNITAGTLTKGRLTSTEDGMLSGNIVSQDSVAGR